MSQHAGSADDEGIQLTYSTLPPGKRPPTPPATPPHNEEPEPRESEPARASQSAWPRLYHRVLTQAFLGALFALGVLLGMVVSESAVSVHFPSKSPVDSLASSSPLLAHPGETTNTMQAAYPGTGGGAPTPKAAAVDARFAIVTLGILCLFNACAGVPLDVPAGQRVYALEGGASCTTLSAVELEGHRVQTVYCRLDQPNVFTASFDGVPFDCVGSRLGCHFVVPVETTNGR